MGYEALEVSDWIRLDFQVGTATVLILILIFFIQAEPYIGITPGCAASESGVTSPELLIMFPYGNLERF